VIGGLAQLVERLLCKQDVSGSSPLTSMEPGSLVRFTRAAVDPKERYCGAKATVTRASGEARGDEDDGKEWTEEIPAFRIRAFGSLMLNAGFTA
jgi:hypothetical protein